MTKSTNKLLSEELKLIFSQSDIIMLTETWSCDLLDLSVDNFILTQLIRAEKRCNRHFQLNWSLNPILIMVKR